MEPWLSSLKALLDVKDGIKLTLPGLVCAFFLILVFWPPKPIDVMPIVQSSLPKLDIRPPRVTQPPFDAFVRRAFMPRTADPGCAVDEYFLEPVVGPTGALFQENNDKARSHQYALEEQSENLQRCLAAESRLVGAEEALNAALEGDLRMLEASRARQSALVADYERLNSPMIPLARGRLEATDRTTELKRAAILKNEQAARDRTWEIAELTRWKGIVSDRLSDPGRLRPELGFDDYLSAMSKHVLAFVFLAAVIAMIIEGISTPGLLKTLESILFGS
jgi:hypothetical protein